MEFRTYGESREPVITPTTVARWSAMLAGEEWLAQVQYQLTSDAYLGTLRATGDEEAAIAAARLYDKMSEVPAPGMPSSSPYGEQKWRAAVALFALAEGVTEEVAETRLREDCKYFIALLRARQQGDSAASWAMAGFTYNECGAGADDFPKRMKTRRHRK